MKNEQDTSHEIKSTEVLRPSLGNVSDVYRKMRDCGDTQLISSDEMNRKINKELEDDQIFEVALFTKLKRG